MGIQDTPNRSSALAALAEKGLNMQTVSMVFACCFRLFRPSVKAMVEERRFGLARKTLPLTSVQRCPFEKFMKARHESSTFQSVDRSSIHLHPSHVFPAYKIHLQVLLADSRSSHLASQLRGFSASFLPTWSHRNSHQNPPSP